MKIVTNNVPRDLIYGYELTDKEKADFDYLEEINPHIFFRYRGMVYDLSGFMVWDNPASPTWDGFASDSFFSGVAIKYVNDFEQVVVATVYS